MVPESQEIGVKGKITLVSVLCPVLAVFFQGCVTVGGHAGLPEHVRSISIPTFQNRTLEYGAEEIVTAVVVHEFQRDGRLRLEHRESADAVLLGTIVSYELIPSGYDRENRLTVSRVETAVKVTVVDQTTGEKLLDQETFRGSGSFFLTPDPAERRQRDVFIRLADNIISRLIEGW
jgi:hypothetical protein